MILQMFLAFFLKERKDMWINPTHFLLRLIVSFINITFYYYAGQSFDFQEKFSHLQSGIFEFIIIGEFLILIPIDLSVSLINQMRKSIQEGSFFLIHFTKTSLFQYFLLSTLMRSLNSFVFAIVSLALASMFYNFQINTSQLFSLLYLIVCYIPLFITIGFLAACLFLVLRRGSNLLGSLFGLISIASGVYFPISAFPPIIEKLITILSPFSSIVLIGRNLMNQPLTFLDHQFSMLLVVLIVGLFILFLTRYFFEIILTFLRKKRVIFAFA